MRDLFEKLVKILRLEQSRKYDDSAVIGGLEGFMAFWLSEARARTANATERRAVEEAGDALRNYGSLPAQERERRVRRVIERLGFAEPAPPPPTAKQAESAPPSTQHALSRDAPSPMPEKKEVPAPPREQGQEAAPPSHSDSARAQPVPQATEGVRTMLAVAQAEEPQPSPSPPSSSALPPPSRQSQAAAEEMLRDDGTLDRPVTEVPGIGTAKARRLERLGIQTIRELLYHAPFRYEDYTTMKQIAELMYGDEVTLAGVIQEIDVYKTKRGTVVITALVGDGTGVIRAKWFGNRYLVNQLPPGTMVRLSGKIDAYMGRLQLNSPRFEIIEEQDVRSGWIVPIYPRTEGITEKALAHNIAAALDFAGGKLPDPLPDEIRHQFGLPDLATALRWLHRPESIEKAQSARRRLAFDELLRLQLGMLQQRRDWRERPGHAIAYDLATVEEFLLHLPFELTGAQRRAIEEILGDMADRRAMSRLLQGDVGSGKTAVAAAALLAAVSAGYQGALMAPTEILAEQHHKGLLD
ncbi:MAG: OB-fold nucleic acid binding domain-containing protein, partial [Ardenticatenaceae bacterium]